MLPEKFMQVLAHEGVVAIATQGCGGPHLVNTWNSYIQVTPDECLLIPAGSMRTTEENVRRDDRVLLTCGARQVPGANGPGTGFLVRGTAAFHTSGPRFESVKAKFPWARAALAITPGSVAQTL